MTPTEAVREADRLARENKPVPAHIVAEVLRQLAEAERAGERKALRDPATH